MRDQNTVKHEFTYPSTPGLNGSPERTIAMFDTVLAARLHAKENLLVLPAKLHSFWGAHVCEDLWLAADAFEMTFSSANPGMKLHYRRYYGAEPELMARPSLRRGYTAERRGEKMSRVQHHAFF